MGVVRCSSSNFRRTKTMTASASTAMTVTAIDNFEKILKQHTAKKLGNAASILEKIQMIKTTNPPIFEEDKVNVFLTQRVKALGVLIDNFMVAKLSSRYPLLDKKIFDFKRYIYINNRVILEDMTIKSKERTSSSGASVGTQIETALFVHTEMNKQKKEIGKCYQYGDTLALWVTVPIVPLPLVELGRKALGFYYNLLAEIYNNPLTSDLYSVKAQPMLEILWIPTLESINVKVDAKIPVPKRYDPALLLNTGQRYYLVGLWSIKEELPFEGILREFTVGPAEFPKKVK